MPNGHESTWRDRTERERQLDEFIQQERTARFGSEVLNEAEKASRVKRHFDAVATKYDLMNTVLSMGIHYLWKREGIRRAKLKPGDTVLDMCGGTGDLSISAYRKVGPAGNVVLYDINYDMIAAGKRTRSHAEIREAIAYVQGDAERIAFPDGTFDVVMIGFAVRNITHMKRAFREMHRVLKPGGTLMCLEFSKPVWPWFRLLYDFYSFHVMPLLGDLIMGERKAYTCLPETIRLFLMPEELAEVFKTIGFSNVAFKRLTNGIAVVHTGVK